MKSYFCMTHYHVMFAMIDVLRTQEEGKIFLGNGYTQFDDEFVDKIKKTDIFSAVIKWETTNIFNFLPRDWATKLDQLDEIKSNYEEFILKQFKDIDFDKDTICFFSPRHWTNWFFYQYAHKVQKFEDGYCNHQAELMNSERLPHEIILEKIYGFSKEEFLTSSKMDKIIVSNDFDNNSPNIEMVDFKYFLDNDLKFQNALIETYKIPELKEFDSATVFASTPIFKNKFQQHLFMVDLVSKYKNEFLIIKAHPADRFDYSFLENEKNILILEKSTPIELLNFQKNKAKMFLSISSTANKLCSFYEKQEIMYDPLIFSTEEIKDKLENDIWNSMVIAPSKNDAHIGQLYCSDKITDSFKKLIFELSSKEYPVNYYKVQKNSFATLFRKNKTKILMKGFEDRKEIKISD